MTASPVDKSITGHQENMLERETSDFIQTKDSNDLRNPRAKTKDI